MRKILTFAAIVEIATGLALLAVPAVVIVLLFGAGQSGEFTLPLARFLGIALLALGVACWPSAPHVGVSAQSFRAMLFYNAFVAVLLAGLYVFAHIGGVLLWPAVALHAVVALLLVWNRRSPS